MKILISQRESLNQYGDLIDSLEANYIEYFNRIGYTSFTVSNFLNNLDEIFECKWDAIVLTGGGILKKDVYNYSVTGYYQEHRDKIENKLIAFANHHQIPILGICRGMQKLNTYFDGTISDFDKLKEERPVGKEHRVSISGNVFYVNNFHSNGIFKKDIGSGFKPLVMDDENCVIEAISGKMMLGIQWHPEREMNDTKGRIITDNLIKEFFTTSKIDE